MNITEREWRKLKTHIQDDIKMCKEEEGRYRKKGDQANAQEWFMAGETGRQFLDEMNRLEKETE